MSNKPPKHSEVKRARQSTAARLASGWGKPRGSSPKRRIKPERHLIVAEGTVTEPLYFAEIKRRINATCHGDYVSVEIAGAGMNTLALLEEARRLARADIAGYTHVWIVYDKDSFPDEAFDAVARACAADEVGGTRFHAAWSNESFELWYLLHFEYLQSALGRDSYTRKLSRRLSAAGLGGYTKNRADMFSCLEDKVETAMANAARLENINAGKTPSSCCPGTTVHHLVGELLPYTKDFK